MIQDSNESHSAGKRESSKVRELNRVVSETH